MNYDAENETPVQAVFPRDLATQATDAAREVGISRAELLRRLVRAHVETTESEH